MSYQRTADAFFVFCSDAPQTTFGSFFCAMYNSNETVYSMLSCHNKKNAAVGCLFSIIASRAAYRKKTAPPMSHGTFFSACRIQFRKKGNKKCAQRALYSTRVKFMSVRKNASFFSDPSRHDSRAGCQCDRAAHQVVTATPYATVRNEAGGAIRVDIGAARKQFFSLLVKQSSSSLA